MRKPWHFEDERYFQTTFVRDWEHRGSGWSYPACVSSSCRIKDQTQWNTILVVSLHFISLLSKNGVYPQIAIFMLGQWWLTLMNQSMEWGILFSDNPLFLVEGSLVSALLQWWRMALPAVPGGPFFSIQGIECVAGCIACQERGCALRKPTGFEPNQETHYGNLRCIRAWCMGLKWFEGFYTHPAKNST